MDDYIPNWQDKSYCLERFKGSELNGLMLVYQVLVRMTLVGTLNLPGKYVSYDGCLRIYESKIRVRGNKLRK